MAHSHGHSHATNKSYGKAFALGIGLNVIFIAVEIRITSYNVCYTKLLRILVDGAVIIVESMIFYLHRNEFIGKKLGLPQRNEIAYNSASKMMNSAFFGQLIILIVFIPVLALQGVEGKMFIPMAMTFGSYNFV